MGVEGGGGGERDQLETAVFLGFPVQEHPNKPQLKVQKTSA